MENIDIKKYIEMALRRKYWIIISFMVVFLVGLAYALSAPKVYEAETLILVQAQKVPQDFIRSIVSSDAEERLRTISQQVTSRTNLESIIQEHKLYSRPEQEDLLMEDKVALLRKNIDISVTARTGRGGGNAFSISFQGSDPRKVMEVANTLASNFISENLKIRESQAIGTSNFLADELATYEKRLRDKEEELSSYRQKHMGELPEHINTNLRMLERAQAELDALYIRLDEAKNRKVMVQQQIKQSEELGSQISGTSDLDSLLEFEDEGSGGAGSFELEELKTRLKSLKLKYTDKHPAVKELKDRIAKLEEQLKESEEENSESDAETENEEVSSFDDFSLSGAGFLETQLSQIDAEINEINKEIADAKEKVGFYNKRVEDTPKREQELLSITRDYDNIKEIYDKMLNRKLEAELSVNMEKKQKGEQFRVVDPARLPQRPVKPDVNKILIVVILFGLGIGGGMAYLVEIMDTTYKTPDEAEKDLDIPVLASIPLLSSEAELKHKKRKEIFTGAGLAVGFVVAATVIVIAAKGFDKTLEYVRGIFGG